MTANAASTNSITTRRIVVGFVLAICGLSCVVIPWAFYVLILVVGLAALFELNALCEMKGQALEFPVAIVAVCAYIVLGIFNQLHKWEGALLSSIIIATFWIGMYGEQKGYFARTAYTLLAVLYIGKLLTFFVFIRQVPVIGMWLTFEVVVLIACTDIFAMLIGTVAGRTPLTKISPRKTVEGAIGAAAIVTVLGIVASTLPQLHFAWYQGAVLGFFTSIAAQAGDLAESALKRDAGVKDTGTVIQGHGGVLDRFDSYLFGGMAFFATLHVLGILAVSE